MLNHGLRHLHSEVTQASAGAYAQETINYVVPPGYNIVVYHVIFHISALEYPNATQTGPSNRKRIYTQLRIAESLPNLSSAEFPASWQALAGYGVITQRQAMTNTRSFYNGIAVSTENFRDEEVVTYYSGKNHYHFPEGYPISRFSKLHVLVDSNYSSATPEINCEVYYDVVKADTFEQLNAMHGRKGRYLNHSVDPEPDNLIIDGAEEQE